MEVIKYEGTRNYIIILFKEQEKLYVFYARTGALVVNSEVEDISSFDNYEHITTMFSFKRDYTINIPLLQRGNTVFSIIQVDDEKEYNLIKTVVEDLL